MHWFLARFSEPVSSVHTPSWADFITATPAFKLSVHTGRDRAAVRDVDAERRQDPPPAKIGTQAARRQTSGLQAPMRLAPFRLRNRASRPTDTLATSGHETAQTAPQTRPAGGLAARRGEAIGRRAS